MTRIGDDGVEEGFPNPIPQIKLQEYPFRKWIQFRGFPEAPIESLVVISFPSTIVKSTSPKYPIPEQVIHNNQLLFTINALNEKRPRHLILFRTIIRPDA